MPRPIDNIELFYAHAVAIEREAAARYEEFARWFAGHGEEILAGLCRNLERAEREHLHMTLGACEDLELPEVDERQFRWLDVESPEALDRDRFYRFTSQRRLLEIALQAERDARRFFAWVARTSRNGHVRNVAREMAREEAEHLRWVQRALDLRNPLRDRERILAEALAPDILTAT